jgi:Na+/H+ antiporter NhaD/arsenite permease-like protein
MIGKRLRFLGLCGGLAGIGCAAFAADPAPQQDLTDSGFGIAALIIFGLAYLVVMLEDRLHLRKSVPVIVAAGVIWLLVSLAVSRQGIPELAGEALKQNILEFGELFLFLLAAITYVNTLEERQVFDALRCWLILRRFSLRQLFWITGALAFCLSPIADNLTTALVVGAVAIAVGSGNARFTVVSCINVVVAANAGGAFSPFGDITTLMVWQNGLVEFTEFFALVIPALLNWLIPAFLMSLSIREGQPEADTKLVAMRPGAWAVLALFLGTILITVLGHNFLHLPPALGMMTGLGCLKLFAYYRNHLGRPKPPHSSAEIVLTGFEEEPERDQFDIFRLMARVEWDTLMFFYGVILCVGGLGTLGYLGLLSRVTYEGLGPTVANTLVGIASAVIDNIPAMFAVISMGPEMTHNQWLLVTLTAGVGGSLLSIGSAAGVALMGQARGTYTFTAHLKWTWAVGLGYAASIGAHLLLNGF